MATRTAAVAGITAGHRYAVREPSPVDPAALPHRVDAVDVSYRWTDDGRTLGHPAHSTHPGRA